MKKALYKQIDDYMNSCVKETAHDSEHIYRVLNYCIMIAANEQNVDYDTLITATLLHDIGRDAQTKKHNEIGADMARAYLKAIEFPKDKIDGVYHAIINHSNSNYGKQKTLEAKILYDADKLDAIGVIGISRALMGVGNYNNPFYCLKNDKINLDEKCETDTFVRYYLTHVCKSYDKFFTKTATEYALKRKLEAERFFEEIVSVVNDNYKSKNELFKHLEN